MGGKKLKAVDQRCDWFAQCFSPATKQVDHPMLGWTNICDAHLAWLKTDPQNPTYFVPPIVAKHWRKMNL